jgi:hypothetical protein
MTATPTPDADTVWQGPFEVDVRLTLSVLRHGIGDPCHQVAGDGSIWRASRMTTGPVTYRIRQDGAQAISAQAWGPGSEELIGSLPELLGSGDDPDSFDPRDDRVRAAHTRFRGMRIPATGRVLESLVPSVLEQRIVGLDAFAMWRRLVTRFGDAAPGPAPTAMRLPPTPQVWQEIPTWEWHRAGVEERKARTIALAASYGGRLEAAAARRPNEPAEVYRMLTAIPGIGVWTAAEVGHRGLPADRRLPPAGPPRRGTGRRNAGAPRGMRGLPGAVAATSLPARAAARADARKPPRTTWPAHASPGLPSYLNVRSDVIFGTGWR